MYLHANHPPFAPMQRPQPIRKYLIRTLLLLGALLLGLGLFIEAADRYLSSQRGAEWLYEDIGQPKSINYSESGLRYLTVGDTSLQPLLLLHGAPGGLFDWLPLAGQDSLYRQFYLIIPERRGYGGTRPRQPEPDVAAQASEMALLLSDAANKPATVAGHSYGAPIAAALAGLSPGQVRQLYAISGQYDPSSEVTFSISYWVAHPFFSYFMPSMLWSANTEKLEHPDALVRAEPLFQSIQCPTYIIHGDEDALVPYSNAAYLAERVPQAEVFTLKGESHPVHVQMPAFFARLFLRTAE